MSGRIERRGCEYNTRPLDEVPNDVSLTIGACFRINAMRAHTHKSPKKFKRYCYADRGFRDMPIPSTGIHTPSTPSVHKCG